MTRRELPVVVTSILAAIIINVVFFSPAQSQESARLCGDRVQIVERLKSVYGETMSGGGLRNSSSIFEVWRSLESGTWTILMTQPNGVTCVMAAGTDWRDVDTGPDGASL
ncbi:MAG: hypothetical protein AAGC81_02235 [Pseudomonadota bacterium]